MTKIFLHPSLRRQIDIAKDGVFACKPGGAVSLPDVHRVQCRECGSYHYARPPGEPWRPVEERAVVCRGCGGIDTFEAAP